MLPKRFQVSAELMAAAVDDRLRHRPHVFIESVFLRQRSGFVEQRARLPVQPFKRVEDILTSDPLVKEYM